MTTLSRLVLGALALAPTVSAQMTGTYIINPTVPLSPVTFPSFADATNALAAQGVGGPCEFLVFDDGGAYNEANPFASGNGTYGTNDAVLVMTTWTGSSPTNRVTFRAAPGERPVLDATGRAMGVFWGGADYVTLEGLEIANATFDGISLYAEAQHGVAEDPIIDRCRIHDCNGAGVAVYGNTPQPANTLIQNCALWSCQLTGGGAFGTTGRFGYISSRRANGTRIVHNTFFVDALSDNANYCVIGARCSSTSEVPFAEISNNVIVKLVAPNAPVFRYNTPTGSTFPLPTVSDSNCLFDVSGGVFALHGANAGTTAATFADWQLTGLDGASIDSDPQLRDPTNDDFHLGATSPCIDASTLVANVAIDADQQPRTAPEDLGADEFSAGDYSVVGVGCPGSTGLTAELDLWSWPFLGNPTFTVALESAPANALGALFGSLGVSPVPIPIGGGCDALLDPGSLVALSVVATDAQGVAAASFAIPSSPGLSGFNIGYQGIVLDAGVALGFTVSNALDVTFDF